MVFGREHAREALAVSHGYAVVAEDGLAGYVETPFFRDGGEVDYVVVRVEGPEGNMFPIVPAARVAQVEPARALVHVTGSRDDLARLPDHLPLGG